MATGVPISELCEEVTCSICLEFFRDPVTVDNCGHSFCRVCLTQSWGEMGAEASCPQCRGAAQTGNLRPNWLLANIVEKVERLNHLEKSVGEEKRAEGKGTVCEKHQESLKLFCQEDQVLICVVCDRSKEHKHHEVIPLEEAFQEYKDKFHTYLEILAKEKETIVACKADTEKESQHLLEQTESEKQKMAAGFRQLHRFLEEKEQILLAQMEKLIQEIAREKDEHLARLSKELASLESLTLEMEEKVQQPASELLQDVRSPLQRCEENIEERFENPVALPLELKWRIQDICDLNCFLEVVMKQFQDTLVSGLQLQEGDFQGRMEGHIHKREGEGTGAELWAVLKSVTK
uniref:Uncharacterized protein n=1 Tax=Sphaerodactylus townsendi TaxID=933632 RepID=A0ACB8EG01_9SAUR